jgi:predicted nucleic acid-binding protein
MATLVDSNVLLDLVTDDLAWADRSAHAMRAAALRGPLLINDVVYAELAPGYPAVEDLDAAIARLELRHDPLPRAGLFLAARVFRAYRRRGGTRTGVLSDFFIGAHAAVTGLPLLTRDPARYRTDFPTVVLVVP